jgi:nucleotide sugar dehydrogenase
MRVAVIGAGKMGLPLACQLARGGAKVTVCDVKQAVVEAIRRGECPIDEPGVAEMLRALMEVGSLSSSTETGRATADSDVIIVIVPVALTSDRNADLGIIEGVTCEIAANLQPGSMVIYETTLPVGTTRNRWKPMIEEGSGLAEGKDDAHAQIREILTDEQRVKYDTMKQEKKKTQQ